MEKKLRHMPLVAPVSGATNLDWTELWFNAMDAVGFLHEARPVGALCRAPLASGGLSSRSLSSEEINEFLNRVLNTDSSNRVTSHSLKHTTLSWASKYGLSEPVRTLLGHHELPGRSYAVYSRDVLTRPLQQYCSMLVNLRLGKFLPDTSRALWMLDASSMPATFDKASAASLHSPSEVYLEQSLGDPVDNSLWARLTASDTLPVDQQDKAEESSEDEVRSTSTADSSDSAESQADASAVAPVSKSKPDLDIPGPCWRNRKSRTVHKAGITDGTTFCGRRTAAGTFEYLEWGASSLNPRCTMCYRADLICTREAMANCLKEMEERKAR